MANILQTISLEQKVLHFDSNSDEDFLYGPVSAQDTVMACHWIGNKPLSKLMKTYFKDIYLLLGIKGLRCCNKVH